MHIQSLLAPQTLLALSLLLSPSLAYPAPISFAHEPSDLLSIYASRSPHDHRDHDHSRSGIDKWVMPGFISKIPVQKIKDGANALERWRRPQPPPPMQTALENDVPGNGGVIKMGSSLGHLIPLNFTMSEQTCASLAAECGCLVDDLSSRILSEYPNGVTFSPPFAHCASPSATITETVRMSMDGREYRATLELHLKGKDRSVHEMRGEEFRVLVGLLEKTAKALWRDVLRKERGLGALSVMGTIEEVSVDAKWVFYEVQRGVARRCS